MSYSYSFVLPVGALLAVFGLLACRPAAVRSCDVLLLLGFRLYLAFLRVASLATPLEGDATLKDLLEIRAP